MKNKKNINQKPKQAASDDEGCDDGDETDSSDVLTLLKPEDQELAEAKLKAQQEMQQTPQQSQPAAKIPSTSTSSRGTSHDSKGPTNRRTSNATDRHHRRRSRQLPQAIPRRATLTIPPSTTRTAAGPNSTSNSITVAPAKCPSTERRVKEKQKQRQKHPKSQYASRSQAVAANLAFRSSQQDSDLDMKEGDVERESLSQETSNSNAKEGTPPPPVNNASNVRHQQSAPVATRRTTRNQKTKQQRHSSPARQAKETAKQQQQLAANSNMAGPQYTSRQQARAVNLAFRASQQDDSEDYSDLIVAAQNEKDDDDESFHDEEDLEGCNNNRTFNEDNEEEAAPTVPLQSQYQAHSPQTKQTEEPSQPGAFRVGTSFAPPPFDDAAIENETEITNQDNDENEDEDVAPNNRNRNIRRGPRQRDAGANRPSFASTSITASQKSLQSVNRSINGRNDDILIEATLVEELSTNNMGTTHNINNGIASANQAIMPEPELVTAEPVTDMDPRVYRKDQSYRTSDMIRTQKGRRFLLMTGGAILVVGIILGTSLGVTMNNREDKIPATDAPTMAPTQFLQDLLPTSTQLAIEDDPTSPQAQAYEWYLEDSMPDNSGDPATLQRFVLATMFYSLNGTDWSSNTDWLDHETPSCQWYTTFSGSICSSGPVGRRNRKRRTLQARFLRGLQPSLSSDKVSSERMLDEDHLNTDQEDSRLFYNRLSLYKNNLHGSLPPEIGLLTFLDVVDLFENKISGTLPSELGLWKHITHLQFFQNSMTGTIPSELGAFEKVRQFNLAFNQLTGTIPTHLSQLSLVQSLSLSNNKLQGPIPSELGLLTQATGLYFYENPALTGPLPSTFGQATRLNVLRVSFCDLTGEIPREYGSLSNLESLELNNNPQLQGTVPSALGLLTKLTRLALHDTDLSGSLPQEICRLTTEGKLMNLTIDCGKVECPCRGSCDCSHTGAGVTPISDEEFVTKAPILTEVSTGNVTDGNETMVGDETDDEFITEPDIFQDVPSFNTSEAPSDSGAMPPNSDQSSGGIYDEFVPSSTQQPTIDEPEVSEEDVTSPPIQLPPRPIVSTQSPSPAPFEPSVALHPSHPTQAPVFIDYGSPEFEQPPDPVFATPPPIGDDLFPWDEQQQGLVDTLVPTEETTNSLELTNARLSTTMVKSNVFLHEDP